MTAAPTYNRVYNFTGFQAAAPATPLPANEVDAELSAIKITLDAILANINLIQRSDGQLANASVGSAQLSPTLSLGVSPASQWSNAGVGYNVGQSVFYGFQLYACIKANVSGALTPNSDPTDWALLADFTANQLAPGSVTTAALAAQAVTTAKIASGAVGAAQIAGGAVGAFQLAPGAVGAAALAANFITAAAIAAAAIDFTRLTPIGLPTTLPSTVNTFWNNGGVICST